MSVILYEIGPFLEIIRARIGDNPQNAFAEEIGISPQYLSDVLNGKRSPGRKLLAALGWKKVVYYQQENPDG